MAPEMTAPAQEGEIALQQFTDKPWNGSASRYGSTEAYCAACLIDENGSGEKVQSKCHLPIKEPGGATNKNALRNAAARLNQVQASSAAKASAKARLRNLMKAAGMTTSLEEGMSLMPDEQDLITEKETIVTQLGDVFEKIKRFFVPFEEDEADQEAFSEEGVSEAVQGLQDEVAQATLVYQLPYEDTEVELTREGLYKKVIMFADRVVHHSLGEGGVLDHSEDALKKMVAAFKEKAFDQVPLLTHHPGPEDKGKEIFAYLGELVDLVLEDNKLVGFFKLTKRGEEVVKENPGLPTSPGYIPNYKRKSDKKRFGPTLQHIATVFTPHLHGLGGWELVRLSAETEVVDLTGAHTEDPENPRKEANPVSEAVNPVMHEEEEVEMTQEEQETPAQETVSLEKRLRELELKLSEKDSYLSQATKRLSMTSNTLRRQGIRKMLHDQFIAQGVPPAKADAAFLLLAESEESNDLIALSADGDASVKGENPFAGAILELLEGYKGTIDFTEKGRADVTRPIDAGEATHQRVMALVEEQGISYRDAMRRLSRAEEVSI